MIAIVTAMMRKVLQMTLIHMVKILNSDNLSDAKYYAKRAVNSTSEINDEAEDFENE